MEKLPRHQWPTFTRCDSGYGSEAVMIEHEQRLLPYLFKLRHTAKVKDLVNCMMRQRALWQDCGDGWEALESSLRLSGWTKERRVVLVREDCFDELKNQWGWGGYTSRRLASCKLMANLVALFYNWWNLYLRFYTIQDVF